MLDIDEIRAQYEKPPKPVRILSARKMRKRLQARGVSIDLKSLERFKQTAEKTRSTPRVFRKGFEREIKRHIKRQKTLAPRAKIPELIVFSWVYQNINQALSLSQIAGATQLSGEVVRTALKRLQGAEVLARTPTRVRVEFLYSILDVKRIRVILARYGSL